MPWRGTLEPAAAFEAVELPEDEDSWTLLGEEKPGWLAGMEDEMADRAAGSGGRAADGSGPE